MTIYNRNVASAHGQETEEVHGGDLRSGDIIVRSYAFTESRRIELVRVKGTSPKRKTLWEVRSADDHPLYVRDMPIGRREQVLREVA